MWLPILCKLETKTHRDGGSTAISQLHEDEARDGPLACVTARFLFATGRDDSLQDERGRLMRRLSHWIARLWARLHGWLLGVCVLASAFGPFDTFRESCVQDGPFRVNFQARSGPFSTMEWRNVQMGIKLLPGTGKMKSKAIARFFVGSKRRWGSFSLWDRRCWERLKLRLFAGTWIYV